MKINHLAVWVCIILLHALGFVWYGALFQEQWAELANVDIENVEPSVAPWIANFLATAIPVYVLAWLFVKLNVNSWTEGAMYGFVIVFSFVLLSFITTDMFAGNPYPLSWINGGLPLVSMTITGAILGVWTKQTSKY